MFEKENLDNDYIEDQETMDEVEDQEDLVVDSDEKIYIEKTEWSFAEIKARIEKGLLDIRPSYQRGARWDDKRKSKLIESIVLEIPIPPIYLAELPDGKFEVIDGQQRIISIISFMKNKEDEDKLPECLKEQNQKKLKLKSLKILDKYNGYYLEQIEELSDFEFNKFPVTIIRKRSDPHIKFELFVRINSGAVKLNDQEVIDVMYKGRFIDFVSDFIENNEKIKGVSFTPSFLENKSINQYLIRAIIMNNFVDENFMLKAYKGKNYNGRYRPFMLKYLEDNRDNSEEIEKSKQFLEKAIENAICIFGEQLFLRTPNLKNKAYNSSVAETQLICLSKYDLKNLKSKKEKVKQSFYDFAEENKDVFTRATNNTENFKKRMSWGKELEIIVNGD